MPITAKAGKEMSDACRDAVLLKLGSRPARFLRGNYRRLYLSVREDDSLAGLSPTSITVMEPTRNHCFVTRSVIKKTAG
ncbi:hypothetical protein J6590_030180 [Homalodisca vitripennis]|nr:hypothetical protein J6590_030180 [Homalodisca vitripennis]